tara:strand:- start:118 stop:708 length:591 start_codon:yes stop_codon:yes gene_type:complete
VKKFLVVLPFLFLLSFSLFAQSELKEFNENRLKITKTGMYTLGAWAVGNMAVSGIALGGAGGSQKHFHQMNIYWNIVNLGLAGSGLYSAITADPASFDLAASISEQAKMEKLLLFNAGLDIGYMAAGLWMLERSKNLNNNPELWKGFGKSVILQGGFLFVFDLALFTILNTNSSTELIQNLQIGMASNGIGISYKF